MQEEDSQENKQVVERRAKKNITKIVLLSLGGLLLVGSLVYDVYAYNSMRRMSGEISAAEMTNKELREQYDQLKRESVSDSAATMKSENITKAPIVTSHDGNFVALSPNSGYMSSVNQTAFEFAPHKDATKYAIELKFMGQENYPTTPPAEQTIAYSPTELQPSRIKIAFNVPSGNYNWRVTAYSTKDGKEVALQSTDSWNYQVR